MNFPYRAMLIRDKIYTDAGTSIGDRLSMHFNIVRLGRLTIKPRKLPILINNTNTVSSRSCVCKNSDNNIENNGEEMAVSGDDDDSNNDSLYIHCE